METEQLLDRIGPVFRWSDAHAAGLPDPVLYGLVGEGRLERLSHGLYRVAGAEVAELDLVVIAAANDRATLCLTTALARHDLTDQIPSRVDVALPRGSRQPTISAPVRWHQFSTSTYDIGREVTDLDGGFTIGMYSPERSIIDAYRLRHLEGDELGRDALKAWLRRPGSQPSRLLDVAASFPKARGRLREELRVLL